MSMESPHLTLPELAAVDSAALLPAGTAVHLAGCAACQARSQAIVAEGTRLLVAGCQPPPSLIDRVFDAIETQPAPPRGGWWPAFGRGRGQSAPMPGEPGRAAGRRRVPRRRWWPLAAGAAAAVAAGAVVAQMIVPGGAGTARAAAVRELAYRTAAVAAAGPDAAPGHWVYWQEKAAGGNPAGEFEVWTTADSSKAAYTFRGKVTIIDAPPAPVMKNGKVVLRHGRPVMSKGPGAFLGQPQVFVLPHDGGVTIGSDSGKVPVSYARLGSLPADPQALVSYLGNLPLQGWGPAPGREFEVIKELLTSYVMPPPLTAELYQALALIPGVTADPQAVDIAGRPGTAFRITLPPAAGGAIDEIIIDPHTFHLMGTQLIAGPQASDHGTVLSGTAILRTALVSGPGILP